MKTKTSLFTPIAAGMLLSGSLAFADTPVDAAAADDGHARVSGIAGSVLVNRGEQFVNTRADTQLDAGDRILLMSGASASLSYADGCAVELESESMVTVGAQSPCAGEPQLANRIGPVTAQAVGSSAAAAGTDDGNDNTAEWAVFGTSAAVIAYLIIDGETVISESTVAPPVSP